MAKYALEGALKAHHELREEMNDDWANLALAYIRTCAVYKGDSVTEDLRRVLEGLGRCDLPISGE